jgi:gamma-glutamyl-gamma-aminobutyrate hydrolase PuuD
MLCALAGGFLIQDVTHHAGHNHLVATKDGRSFMVNSLHHQMLYPFDVEHEMVAWSAPALSSHYLDVNDPIEVPIEPEFVYFPKEKGIAIQWHPEYMRYEMEAQEYVKEQLEKRL